MDEKEKGIREVLKSPTRENLLQLIRDESVHEQIFQMAGVARDAWYGRTVYLRGLIEISSYCKNDCYYCGIRAGNRHAGRYRLSADQILDCVEVGKELGFSTFVLQGGEDPWFTDERVCDIICRMKECAPGCAVTLSLGERSLESYQRMREAGADRYLLRHETSDEDHYAKLHPPTLSLRHRKECLRNLKKLGYQTGAGFMVGSPYQSLQNLAEDLMFLCELKPEMVGIGPFLPHHESVFAEFQKNPAMKTQIRDPLQMTVLMVAMTRLLLPAALIPATTALSTLSARGRAMALDAGANVVMPNLSPAAVRSSYLLYDNKASFGSEAAESLATIRQELEAYGYRVDMGRGDHRPQPFSTIA